MPGPSLGEEIMELRCTITEEIMELRCAITELRTIVFTLMEPEVAERFQEDWFGLKPIPDKYK